jgi:hypothetical protein
LDAWWYNGHRIHVETLAAARRYEIDFVQDPGVYSRILEEEDGKK